MGLFAIVHRLAGGPAPSMAYSRFARAPREASRARGRSSVASMLSQDVDEETKDWEVLYPTGDCEAFLKSTCDNGYSDYGRMFP